ncbi:hypothetical protein [Eoetvoesiella caeni]
MINQIYPDSGFMKIKEISPERREMLEKIGLKSTFNTFEQREDQWREIYNHAIQNGLLGLTLTTSDQMRWAVITPDVEKAGWTRYSVFDRRGFFGHGVYPLPEKAVEAVFDMGYRCVDNAQRLDSIAATWLSVDRLF